MVAKPNKGLEEDAAPGDLAEAGSSGCPLQKQRGCGQGLQELAPTAPQIPGPGGTLRHSGWGCEGHRAPERAGPAQGGPIAFQSPAFPW